MRKQGWLDKAGNEVWPEDPAARQKMARGLFGMELVSHTDFWALIAEDELDDTHDAPWAGARTMPNPELEGYRESLQELKPEQRETVRSLLRYALKGQLHSFCCTLDRALGGPTITIPSPGTDPSDDIRMVLHSPGSDELIYEQFQWLEDFSILFGEDERYGDPEAPEQPNS
ncbi:MAG: hypothetical protein WDN28_02890 [Chthoniobacter sp.]